MVPRGSSANAGHFAGDTASNSAFDSSAAAIDSASKGNDYFSGAKNVLEDAAAASQTL